MDEKAPARRPNRTMGVETREYRVGQEHTITVVGRFAANERFDQGRCRVATTKTGLTWTLRDVQARGGKIEIRAMLSGRYNPDVDDEFGDLNITLAYADGDQQLMGLTQISYIL